MTWVQTFTGAAVSLLQPDPQMIRLEDIAHALSRQCRYNGHTAKHYSVAEHSVLVSTVAQYPIVGLFHDAAEAYIGDLVSPMKRALGHRVMLEWNLIERGLDRAIATRFGFDPDELHFSDVKEADYRVLVAERTALFPVEAAPWLLRPAKPVDEVIRCYSAEDAKGLFLTRARELGVR